MVLSKDMKIAICFGLIIGCFFSFCGLCFGAENIDVELDVLTSANVNSSTSTIVASADTSNVYYFKALPGYKYILSSSAYTFNIRSTDETPVIGSYAPLVTSVSAGGSYEFYGDGITYILTATNPDRIKYLNVTMSDVGLIGFVDNLAYTLSFSNLWGIVGNIVPILGITILFVLGIYLLYRLINRIKRKKGGI